MKKWLKIVLWVFSGIAIVSVCIFGYFYYKFWGRFSIDSENYPYNVEYIDPEQAISSDSFEICDEEKIAQYYNPQRATYSKGKNGLRKFILSNYQNRGYFDSGYLNVRFIINCRGQAGRYITHENNLDLEPTELDEDMVAQLFELTKQLKEWNPNIIRGEKRDSYMYISYRIENGEIVEILP